MSTAPELEAGTELDRLIATKVMGWASYHYDKGGLSNEYWSLIDHDGEVIVYSDRPGRYSVEFPSESEAFAWFKPSQNIAQAWQVVEWLTMEGRARFEVRKDGLSTYAACVDGRCATAPSAPLAICRAAMKAISA